VQAPVCHRKEVVRPPVKSEVSEAKGGDHKLPFAHTSDEKGEEE